MCNPRWPKIFIGYLNSLRYVTYEAGNEFMPLREKFRRLHLFAPKRFEDTLFLEYTVEGIMEQRVPSLVLYILSKIFSNMA
jgi:hypothetical protein